MYRHLTNEELRIALVASPDDVAIRDEVSRRVMTGALFFAPRMERSDL